MDYLEEQKPGVYSRLIMSGNINHYLADLNKHAQARLDLIVQKMTAAEGVDERLKAVDQME